ncbi:MAG: hypothetical protein OXI72_13410 [Gemmatimonadota bacterium]|nr:hypothetical protein [Gemmatimonadota bacterium]
MDYIEKYGLEVVDTSAALAVLAQTFSENDPSFPERLEKNCERLFRILGEGGSRYFSENKAAATLSLAGTFLEKIKESELKGEWEDL